MHDGFRELQIVIISYGHQHGRLKDFDLNYNISDFNPMMTFVKNKKKEEVICPEAQKKYSEIFDPVFDYLLSKIKKSAKRITIGINCLEGQKWSVVFAKLLYNDLNNELIEGVRLKASVQNRDTVCNL